MQLLEIFKSGTEVKLKNCRHLTVLVDKVIIGDNDVIQYQLIGYTPDRNQMVVNAFEIEIPPDKERCTIGFHQPEITKKVKIQIDKNGKFIDTIADGGIDVSIELINEKEEVNNEQEQTSK